MLTYLPNNLRALNSGRPPPRAVRKRLFTFRLWRQARYRQQATVSVGVEMLPNVNTDKRAVSTDGNGANPSTCRSADRQLTIGWLNAQSIRNKTDTVHATITERSVDVLSLTETWHAASDDTCLRLATPAGYAVVDAARSSGRGGGVAVICRRHLKCSRVPVPACSTFEVICVRLTTTDGPVIILNVYRPGSDRPSALFYDELASVLEMLVVYSCPVVVGGDFNIRVQDTDDYDSRHLSDLLTSFDMIQHVRGSTHRCGNTLDLVVTFADRCPDSVIIDPPGAISDHALVVCRIPISVDQPSMAERLVRGWRRVNRNEVRRALKSSKLCCPVPADTDVDQLFTTYDTVLREIADRLAPTRSTRRHPGRPTPWFDDECRTARRECRRLERRYRRTDCAEDRRLWVEATRSRFRFYRKKKEDYWLQRLTQCGRSPSVLWRSLSSMLGRDRDVTSATSHTADNFAVFFAKKIDDVRSATAGLPPPDDTSRASSSLSSFRPCSQGEIRRIIMLSPVKSCSLDPVPTFLVREFVDQLLPFMTSMVNASLAQGRLPTTQKHAIVTPLLKKPGLDTADMSNYRPVSNLTFISKVVERAVAMQLNGYLMSNNLLPCCQSAYRKKHSTETAMLRVLSDFLMAADEKQVTLLGLLDMSAAFDCVDHVLLLQRLRLGFGLEDDVIDWIQSFLTDRTQQIAYDGTTSSAQPVYFGVPQGSVLGPILYVLYTAELELIVQRHGMRLHQYADDCQIYVSVLAGDASTAAQRFSVCIADVNRWLSASRLRLNPAKTQVMWLGSSQQLQKVVISDVIVLSTPVRVIGTARDLGVVIDSQLSLSAHITALCRSGYYQLRQLRPVVSSLSSDAAKTLVHAFISCRLDYCNSLLHGIADGLLRKLQCVQNAAARLITGARRRDHITPVLRELHWLPVRQRIVFKVACLVFQSLSGQAPGYLTTDCRLVTGRLRSADKRMCIVPRTHTRFGDRSFSASGCRIWNTLPDSLRQPDISYEHFKGQLKTFLFNDHGAL